MELEIERSVEDNELLDTEGFERNGEVDAKLKNNGNYAENVDSKLLDDIKDEVDAVKTKVSPSQSPAMKGKGLRKWRRIRRESSNETNSYLDSNRKRGIVTLPVVTKQRSEGSSSSNAMLNVLGNALDHIGQYRDFGSGMGPGFASRADSENSEDQNSRSSTAASAPRMNHELPVLGLGFGKDTIRNLSGMNSGISVQSDQQEKSQNVTKKARGVRIKKENSISSIESDSRSSTFLFMQGSNSITSNGRRSGRSGNYEEDDSDDAQNGDRHLNNEVGVPFSKNEADSEYVSHEDLAGENSWEVKDEKADDPVGSGNQDDLVDSFTPLHLAQEALAREVQKLSDVGKEESLSSNDWVEPSGSSFVDDEFQSNKINEVHLQSKLEEAFVMLDLKNTKIAQLEAALEYNEIKTEFEELVRQRIAAELEFLVISKTIQDLKGGLDQTNIKVQLKNIAAATTPEHVQIADAGEAKEDSWKLKNRVYKYASCFTIQSVLLLVVLYMFILQFSSKTVEVIPT